MLQIHKGKHLLLTRTSAQFNPQAQCWVDVQRSEELLEEIEERARSGWLRWPQGHANLSGVTRSSERRL